MMPKKTTNTVKTKTGKDNKKTTAAKPVKKTAQIDAQRESLAKELRSLIPQLDSEGLAFLVEQARIHLYNMQVEELNQAAEAADAASARKAGIAGGRGSAKTGEAKFRIDGSESGNSYYLHYRNNELMFSRGEMTHLVKMVNAPGTNLEIRERLYNWFDRERKDAFAVIPMADKFDEHLKILVSYLKDNLKFK